MRYKTKIMATMGPTLVEIDELVRAINTGVRYFRLHLGSRERDVCKYIENVEEAIKVTGVNVGVLLDLPSSRPRVAVLPYHELIVGEKYIITNNTDKCTENYIPIPGIEKLINNLKIGERLLFRDGKIILEILEINNNEISTICLGCSSKIGKGCSCVMPDSEVYYDSIVEEDLNVFKKMKQKKQVPDYVCISFASSVKQINMVKKIISQYWSIDEVKIIVKIENKFGVNRFKELLEVADGLMLGRGDLALHIDPTLVPIIQEKVCRYCNENNKICVIGTEFFENFACTGVVSRPELNDVANTTRQDATAIMLSMESANSKFPFETLEMVNTIISNVNNYVGIEKEVVIND